MSNTNEGILNYNTILNTNNYTSKKKSKTLRPVVITFLFLSLILCAIFSITLIRVKNVEINGCDFVSKESVAAAIALSNNSSLIGLNTDALSANILANPKIQSVNIVKTFPNTLKIYIAERIPLAVVYVRNSSGQLLAHYVDKDAVVFALASEYSSVDVSKLPVISGLDIIRLKHGFKLGEPFLSLLESLAAVSIQNPSLYYAISELRGVVQNGKMAEVLVYPSSYHIPVRMKPFLHGNTLKSMLLVLDVIEKQGFGNSISEIDMRNEIYTYRTKEAVSG